MVLQNYRDFILEDNILKGPETSINLKSSNIGELLLDAFSENPDHVSQIDADTGDRITHAEMKDRSIRCALWMEKQGVSCDDVVCLCPDSQLDACVPVLATFFVQAALNPWLCDATSDDIRRLLGFLQPKLVFARADVVDALEEALSSAKMSTKIVVLGEHPRHPSLNDILRSQSSGDVEMYRPSNRKSPREVAIIINSSGTTGPPKSITISAEVLYRNALDRSYELWRGKNVLCYVSSSGLLTVNAMLACILQNATRILSNSAEPREMCRVMQDFEVNYVYMTPSAVGSLARFQEIDKYNLSCLEVLRIGADRLNRATFNKLKSSCLRDKIYQGYGTTEICGSRLQPNFERCLTSHNSIGFVSSNLQLKIIDRLTNKTLGANSLGEILIKTSFAMLGYYENPEATRKVLDDEGWYHTGDLGYYDESGEIFFMGRINDAFEYCGQEFFTNEIEDILWEHPALMDLIVIPVPRKSVGKVPVAFVVIQAEEHATQHEMMELLKTSDKHKNLPLSVQFINKIPVTSANKIAKSYLMKLALKTFNERNEIILQ